MQYIQGRLSHGCIVSYKIVSIPAYCPHPIGPSSIKFLRASLICCNYVAESAESFTEIWAEFCLHPTEKIETKVIAQGNKSCKYSQSVLSIAHMWYMTRNRAASAHCTPLKIAKNLDLTDWINGVCQNINREHQTRQLSCALSRALSHGLLA